MSQQKFADELGVSLGSIRAYETGTHISDASMEAMKTLAASRGFANLVPGNGPDFAASHVFDPAERVKAVRLRASSHGRDMSDEMHAALDDILERGTPDAIGSIEFILRCTKAQLPETKKGRRGDGVN